MTRWWYRFVFRLVTNDNWRWLALVGLSALLLFIGVALLPYALTPPETSYERAQRGLADFIERSRYGAVSYRLGDEFSAILRGLGWVVFGLFGVAALTTFVYFFPAFGDDAGRAVEAVRVRMWDRYGAEIRRSGFFTRLFLGQNPPAGSNPSAAAAASAGGGQPLTKPAFLFWEAAIDFVNEFLGHRLWGRR